MIETREDGFEGAFVSHTKGAGNYPMGWTPDWSEGDPDDSPGIMVRPEWSKKDTRLGHPEVRYGKQAACFFTTHATHDAVLYHSWVVPQGAHLLAEVWGYIVCHDDDGSPGGMGIQVGVDPTGGFDFQADTVVWGDWYSTYMKEEYQEREWARLAAETDSEGQLATVFLRSRSDHPVDISAAHFDDFVLSWPSIAAPTDPSPEPSTGRLVELANTLRSVAAELEGMNAVQGELKSALEAALDLL